MKLIDNIYIKSKNYLTLTNLNFFITIFEKKLIYKKSIPFYIIIV